MTKMQLFFNILCFCLLLLGAFRLLSGHIESGIYLNTLVVALQSILIAQQVILKNNNSSGDNK